MFKVGFWVNSVIWQYNQLFQFDCWIIHIYGSMTQYMTRIVRQMKNVTN